jgi:hypothetical protein
MAIASNRKSKRTNTNFKNKPIKNGKIYSNKGL